MAERLISSAILIQTDWGLASHVHVANIYVISAFGMAPAKRHAIDLNRCRFFLFPKIVYEILITLEWHSTENAFKISVTTFRLS